MTSLTLLAALLLFALIARRRHDQEMFTLDVWRGIQKLPAARKDEGPSRLVVLRRLLK